MSNNREITNVRSLAQQLRVDKWAFSRTILELRDCKEAARIAMRVNGYSLMGASKRLRDDIFIVREAIKQNPNALEYASDRLKRHEGLFLEVKDRDFFDPEGCGVSQRLLRKYGGRK